MSRADETLLDLALSRATVDRSARERAADATVAQALRDRRTRVLVIKDGRSRLLDGGRAALALRAPARGDLERTPWFLGRHDGIAYLAVDDTQPEDPAAERPEPVAEQGWVSLREVGADLDDTEAGLLTTATALHGWHCRHRHCPRCGSVTEVVQGGWVRRCPQDGSEHYPRTDPAVIVSVVDEADRLLLATGNSWPEGRISVLAGFVEAGETMEAAAVREVHEEVGVRIGDLSFRGDQPWPFPASLMLGFRATALTTSLTPDPTEIRSAAWYTRDELGTLVAAGERTLPSRVSIARVLIEEWFHGPLPEAPPEAPPESRR